LEVAIEIVEEDLSSTVVDFCRLENFSLREGCDVWGGSERKVEYRDPEHKEPEPKDNLNKVPMPLVAACGHEKRILQENPRSAELGRTGVFMQSVY
jgi:hypothetical protein